MILRLIHDACVHTRRARVLSEMLADMIPPRSSVLDVGCGDGVLDQALMKARPDIHLEGIDILVRPSARIPVREFDGFRMPYENRSFDVLLFMDVLHHAEDMKALLVEANRVTCNVIIVKDHILAGILAMQRLRFMDWAGNVHHGMTIPHCYLTRPQWCQLFEQVGLMPEHWHCRFRLYPRPLDWIFGGALQFVVSLTPRKGTGRES